jgi:hypothetical protein
MLVPFETTAAVNVYINPLMVISVGPSGDRRGTSIRVSDGTSIIVLGDPKIAADKIGEALKELA